MKVLIFGGSGLIGRALMAHPEAGEWEWIVVTRKPGLKPTRSNALYLPYEEKDLLPHFTGEYGIVNLAGAGIGDRPWTAARKRKILDSRLSVVNMIVSLVSAASVKPRFIVQASAVGFYGTRGDELLDEAAAAGKGFLPDVVEAWENALEVDRGIRTVFLRTGLVLTAEGGFLSPLLPLFRLFAGGHFGNGRQWMPWIHMDDEVGAIRHLMRDEQATGPFNLVAPNPVRAKEFAAALGKALRRPSWLHLPAFLVRILPNGFGEELLLTSQHVKPRRLLDSGYSFTFSQLRPALEDLFAHE